VQQETPDFNIRVGLGYVLPRATIGLGSLRLSLRGFLSDISLTGCYFETITPEPVGTPVEVTFQAAGASVRLSGVVRVVHPSMGMGIEFANLSPEAAKALQGLVKAQAAGAS
jgi:hypothetical protein